MTVTAELAAADSVAVMVRLLVPALPSVMLGYDGDRLMTGSGLTSSSMMVAQVLELEAWSANTAPDAEDSVMLKLSLFS